MFIKLKGIIAVLIFFGGIHSSASYASEPQSEATNYLEQIEAKPKFTMHSSLLMGDKVDVASGSFSFEVVDLSLGGNFALPVEVRRTSAFGPEIDSSAKDFASWNLALPHIRTKELAIEGQLPSGGIWSQNKACSGVMWAKTTPSIVVNSGGVHTIQSAARDYWDGDFISIPGSYSGKLLARSSDGKNRYLANHWKIECITVSGVEGFRVTASDGTKYEFTKRRRIKGKKIQLGPETPVANYDGNSQIIDAPVFNLPGDPLTREFRVYHTFMLPSKVTDRFGNTVTYGYNASNKITSITASDGRKITFGYNTKGYISSATAHGRTTYYSYENYGTIQFFGSVEWLNEVTLPSGKEWQYEVPNFSNTYERLHWEDYFTNTHFVGSAALSPELCLAGTHGQAISITHPDGAVGDFYFKENAQRRVNVPEVILSLTFDIGGNIRPEAYQLKPCTSIYSLEKKDIINSGGQVYTWNYEYIGEDGSFAGNSTPTHSSHTSIASYLPSGFAAKDLKTTRVTHPDNSVVKHHINTKFGPYEGKEVLTEFFDTNGSTLLRRVAQDYVESTRTNGKSWMQYDETSDRQALPRVTKISENTETYYTQNYYDTNDLNVKVKEWNSVGKTRYSKYEYHSETSLSIFGLLKRTLLSTTDSNYKEVSKTVFHPLSSGYIALPKEEVSYGKTVKKYEAYHTANGRKGLPSKVSFNRTNSEVYIDNYKRGKATQIRQRATTTSNLVTAKQNIDNFGNVTRIEDFEGNVTSFGYDSANRLTYIDPSNSRWLNTTISYSTTSSNDGFSYVNSGMIKASISQGNYRLDKYYDSFLRPVFSAEWDTNNKSNTVRYQRFKHDYMNRSTYTSQVMGTETTSRGVLSVYDGLGRIKSVDDNTTSGAISYSYLTDNKVRVNNNRGFNTTTQYLAYGSPTQTEAVKIDAPHGVSTAINYNVFGNVTSISQGGLTESRVYDSAQRLCKTVRSDIGNHAYSYNTSGQMTWSAHGDSVNSGTGCDYSVQSTDKITYAYDNHGNLDSTEYGDSSPSKLFDYDNNDQLVKAISGSVTQEYTYNDLNLLASETLKVDGVNWVITYGYDSKGNQSSVQYPSGGSLTYSPNALGQATKVGNFANTIAFHGNGQYKSYKHQNGCINTLTQHTSGLPYLQKTTCGTTNVVYNAYSWDANGNLTQWDDRQSNTYDLRLTYDQLDRVDNYRNFSNTLLGDMNYDPMGNITKFDSVVGSAIHYTYNSSNKRLMSVSGYKNYAFSYDERGNIVDNGRDTLTYNLAGQVTSIGGYDYVYDAHNRRVKTIDTQGVRYSMYTLSGKLIHERINGANRENYYLGSQLVAHQGAGEKKYIHPDVLGGTAATTNAAKSPERTRYAPYGSAWGHTPKNEIGYTGHKQDSDTGLVYMQARYYDPVIGRFYSNDPVGWTPKNPVMSFNRYLYVNNNPYKYTDPNGEFLDAIVDIGFIAYDLYDMATNGVNATNSASLTANVAGLMIPGATGLGLGVRAGDKGIDAARASNKSPCPLSCFVAGTQVLTKEGYKGIENIQVGDLVWATNVETNESAWKKVTHRWTVLDKDIYEIGIVSPEGSYQTIESTESHPFYVIGKGWVNTVDLTLGDQFINNEGVPIKVSSLKSLNRRDTAYNFTVEDYHTYFVTEQNVLVHNCGFGNKRVLENTKIRHKEISMDVERGGSGKINVHAKVDGVKYFQNSDGQFVSKDGNMLNKKIVKDSTFQKALKKAAEVIEKNAL